MPARSRLAALLAVGSRVEKPCDSCLKQGILFGGGVPPMPLGTDLARRLNISYPIIQAPMAGGGDTPQLVAAVSEAGGMGSIGAAYLTLTQIGEVAKDVRQRTSRPFAINLFAPVPLSSSSVRSDVALTRIAPFF